VRSIFSFLIWMHFGLVLTLYALYFLQIQTARKIFRVVIRRPAVEHRSQAKAILLVRGLVVATATIIGRPGIRQGGGRDDGSLKFRCHRRHAMQLTLYTDYSLRVLLYLGVNPRRMVTITDIAQSYGISRNHLVKVVHNLATQEFIHTSRGRGGGITLARPAAEINIGDVVRHTEVNFHLVECFDRERNRCPIAAACSLKNALSEAQRAFIAVLDSYTLADVVDNKEWLGDVLKVPAAGDA